MINWNRIGVFIMIIECALPYVVAAISKSWINAHPVIIGAYGVLVIAGSPFIITPMVFDDRNPFKRKKPRYN